MNEKLRLRYVLLIMIRLQSSFLTINNSNPLLMNLEKKIQQAHNLSYKHLLPLSLSLRPQAVKGRKISQACL